MFNSAPPLLSLTTEQIQEYLEENKELILAILEAQKLGKFFEIARCQAKLQHNLTFLAKLADAASQAQEPSQGLGMQQPPQVAISQPQPDPSAMNLPLDMNEQQQHQQQHLAIPLHQPDISTTKLPFQMNEQNLKLPFVFQQHQVIRGPTGSFTGTISGIYHQASQNRLGNQSDTPSSNHIGSDFGPGWS